MKNFVLFLLTLGTSSFAMNCIEATMLRAMPMPLMSEYVLDSVYDREILDGGSGNTEIIKIHYSGNEQTSLTFYGTDGSVLQEANYRVSVSGTGPEFKVERRFGSSLDSDEVSMFYVYKDSLYIKYSADSKKNIFISNDTLYYFQINAKNINPKIVLQDKEDSSKCIEKSFEELLPGAENTWGTVLYSANIKVQSYGDTVKLVYDKGDYISTEFYVKYKPSIAAIAPRVRQKGTLTGGSRFFDLKGRALEQKNQQKIILSN